MSSQNIHFTYHSGNSFLNLDKNISERRAME
jgi:hypothetical protein